MAHASSTRWDSYGDALKLGESELLALFAARRAMYQSRSNAKPHANVQELRAHRRLSVQGALWVPAEIREANGNLFRLKVYPIDLSSSGICFFGERFLHPGTNCAVTLRLFDGEMLQMTGRVVRCEYIHGQAHEIGVEFDEHLDLALCFPNVPAASISPAGSPSSSPRDGVAAKSDPAEPAANATVHHSMSASHSQAQAAPGPAITAAPSAVLAMELEKRLQAMAHELNSIAQNLAKLHSESNQRNPPGRAPMGVSAA